MKNNKLDLKKVVGVSIFASLAYVISLVFRIPVQFLTFDAKDAVLAVASFIYGPVAAVAMSLIASLIEFVTISDTGIIGALMNFVSSAAFAGTAALIYKRKRTFNGAIIGIFSAVAITTAVMVVMNIFITPIYIHQDVSVVISMLPTILLPFNFAKALMNGALTMLIYKPIAIAMRRAKLIDGKAMDTKFGLKSVITIILGVEAMILAAVIFIVL